MEILIVVIAAIVGWMVYEFANAPTYDEEKGVFYKKKKK